MICPSCGGTFEGSLCPDCDTANADDPLARPDSSWVVVYGGDPKWRLVIGETLTSAGIVNQTQEERVQILDPSYRVPAHWMEI